MKQEKIYLKDYKSPAYSVQSVQLDFNLNEDFCRVSARSEITQIRAEPIELDGVDLKLISIKIDGRPLSPTEYSIQENKLMTIAQVPSRFVLEVETELEPQNNTSLEGLYKSNGIFCTQCEAQGFRTITYFLDRPDVMTKYAVSIEADKLKYPILLSNGDRLRIQDLGNGRHKAFWRDPHKKPSYLFALVAGDLGMIRDSFTTASGRSVNLEIYAAHGKQERCLFAMSSLKKALRWDEEVFGLEYDLNDYMIVAIDDFNAGAMENKGLNIFNSRLVLADKGSATDADFQAIEAVVAHEYFHNWTGNRVTLRDWFQLSLKEGLTVFRDQEFSADMLDRGVQRIADVDHLRSSQFAEDAGPNAHPVRPESCMAVDNFFTTTIYEKGAEVIRMMQTIVGRKGFRKGMDEYFRRHDGQAVTTEDFAAAIAEANHKDFSQFKLWYRQAGTPLVQVTETYDQSRQEYRLKLQQSCPPTPQQAEKKPFHIPLRLALLDETGNELPLHCEKVSQNSDGQFLLELRTAEEEFIFQKIPQRPFLSLLREFSAPIQLKWEPSDEVLYFLMQKDQDSFNRREAAQKLSLQQLSQLIRQARAQETLSVDPTFLQVMSVVLHDAKMDEAFKALMIQLPSNAILVQKESVLDAGAFLAARRFLRRSVAEANKEILLTIYQQCQGKDHAKSRDLKNAVLVYLAELKDEKTQALLAQQYYQTANMTDQMAALGLLVSAEHPEREAALAHFYETWKEDTLVINKWLSVQAMSTRSSVLEDVKTLCQHPSFNINNPNNVYSLLRTFGANLLRFHDPHTQAYSFYADKIIELDPKNPQVAARLCAAFNLTKKLDPEMKERTLTQVRRILAQKDLSKNTRELLQPVLE